MSTRVIKQFVVGNKAEGADFSVEEIESLIYKIAYWYASPDCDRKYADPAATAKKQIKQCLLGTNSEGGTWKTCPNEFATRVKSMCNYDMEKDEGIRVKNRGRPVTPREIRREDKKAKDGAKVLNNLNSAHFTFNQDEFRTKIENDIFAAFPELDNPAHRPNVRSLSGLYAQREVIDRELAAGVKGGARENLFRALKLVEEMSDGLMKRLGVHPDQVRKKISDKGAASIADLVALVSEDSEYMAREKVWAQQLALQLWWMSEHNNGRNTGPNIEAFEVWHLTRSRPMHYKCNCGKEVTLVEGFEPQDLLQYLMREGVLVEEPVIPGVGTEKALKGLSKYVKPDGAHDDNGSLPGRGSDGAAIQSPQEGEGERAPDLSLRGAENDRLLTEPPRLNEES